MKNNLLVILFIIIFPLYSVAQNHNHDFVFNRVSLQLPYIKDTIPAIKEVVPYSNGFICSLWPQGFANKANCDSNEKCCHSFASESLILGIFEKELNKEIFSEGIGYGSSISKNGTSFIMAFIYKGEEYILRDVDSFYRLSIRKGVGEIPVDSVSNGKIREFGSTRWSSVIQAGNNIWCYSDANTIIKVHGNKIDIIE